MFKKILLPLLLLFSCAFCRAASQVPVEMLGKNKGEVQVINKDGVNYAEAVRLSKILKLQTSWFGRSGQLNLKGPAGFFCVLRAGEQNAAVNGESYKLEAPLLLEDGVLYAPISFFNSSKIRFYTGFQTELSGGKIIIEKLYDIELSEVKETASSAALIFKTKGEVSFNKDKRGKYFAEIFFPKAIIKREETLRPKSSFIDRVKIRQTEEGAALSVQLKGRGHEWEVFQEGDYIAFASGESTPKSPLLAYTAAADSKALEAEEVQSADNISVLEKPSVLGEEPSDSVSAENDAVELGDEFFEASAKPLQTQSKPATAKNAPAKTIQPKKTVVNKLVTAKEYEELKKPAPQTGKFRILIDPGHGGKDPGAVKKGSSKEKDLNLAVAKILYDLLKKEKGFEVIFNCPDETRFPSYKKVFWDIKTTIQKVNQMKAFLSYRSGLSDIVGAFCRQTPQYVIYPDKIYDIRGFQNHAEGAKAYLEFCSIKQNFDNNKVHELMFNEDTFDEILRQF